MTNELKPIGKDAARVQLEHDLRDLLQIAVYHGMTKLDTVSVMMKIVNEIVTETPWESVL